MCGLCVVRFEARPGRAVGCASSFAGGGASCSSGEPGVPDHEGEEEDQADYRVGPGPAFGVAAVVVAHEPASWRALSWRRASMVRASMAASSRSAAWSL